MAVSFKQCPPEVREMADELIGEYHPHLDGAEIRYLFRSKAKKRGSHTVLGSCRVVNGLAAFLATKPDELFGIRMLKGQDYMPQFFVIDFAEDAWKDLNDAQRRALIDHELCHCGIDEETGELGLVEHDIEEFGAILERHGAWKPDLRDFAMKAAYALQLELPV